MSRTCDICSKGYITVTNISHKQSGGWAKRAPKTKSKSYPNLRNLRVNIGDSQSSLKIKICTRCYRTLRNK
jgi:large subunit ribosomal protein L28